MFVRLEPISLTTVCNGLAQNAPIDVMKAAYDACFDGVVRIILQTDDHSELQVFYLQHFFHKDFVIFNFTSQITYYHYWLSECYGISSSFCSRGEARNSHLGFWIYNEKFACCCFEVIN